MLHYSHKQKGILKSEVSFTTDTDSLRKEGNDMNKKIGTFIALLRKENHMTQEQLAEKLGVTNRSVSRWENGYTLPDLSIMQCLCEEFGITITELLNGAYFKTADDDNLKASRHPSDFKQSLLLFSQLVHYENLQKSKTIRFYFSIGLFFHGIILLQVFYSSLLLSSAPIFTLPQAFVLFFLGVFFEAAGFYYNHRTKEFTQQELQVFLQNETGLHMKTGEEMFQFARKTQKHILKQHKLAFEKIAMNLSEGEEVVFAMAAEEHIINHTSVSWHTGVAVTNKRVILCGETMRGMLFPDYTTDFINRSDIADISLNTCGLSPDIVISSHTLTFQLKGEKMSALLPALKQSLD